MKTRTVFPKVVLLYYLNMYQIVFPLIKYASIGTVESDKTTVIGGEREEEYG